MAFSRLAARLKNFTASQSGAVLPIIVGTMLVVIGGMGLAVDVGRMVLVRQQLTSSLDAAGLAVGARLSTTDYNGEARKFVLANFPANYVGATVTNVTAVPNTEKSIIALTATASFPTTFMVLFGFQTLTVDAATEVTRATTGLELALVLDTTGSMSSSIGTLKVAAKDLVGLLYGDEAEPRDLFVGVVPFSQAVSIGTARLSWIDQNYKNSLSWGKKPWTGCVEARLNGQDQTDTPPTGSNVFKAYYSRDTNNDPNKSCPTPMTGLTNKRSVVDAGITALKATGNTHVNLGAVWGWRMLSPKWRGSWGGDMATHKLPLDYFTPKMSKAAVIMTDGDNTMNSDIYTAYGYLSAGRLGTTNSTATAEKQLDARLTTVCNAMKAAGIEVYTVAFRNPGNTIKTLLTNCATKPAYYFDSKTPEDLLKDFQTIGSALSNLRVSR